MNNALRTTVLLATLTALMIWVGGALGGQNGMVVAFVIAAATNAIGYWLSDKIVLKSYRAIPLSDPRVSEILSSDQVRTLERLVNNLRVKAGLPVTPALYVIPSESLNAFATGRNPHHAAVAVTAGIMRLLREEEIEGVLAHELTHVKNRDILTATIAATIAGAITMLAHMMQWGLMFGGGRRDDREGGASGLELLVMIIVAPIAAAIIQSAVSRSREFAADEGGARACGNPLGLASALEKLEIASRQLPLPAGPATAHLFIVNPLSGASVMRWFATHPPIEERIARLRAMVGRAR